MAGRPRTRAKREAAAAEAAARAGLVPTPPPEPEPQPAPAPPRLSQGGRRAEPIPVAVVEVPTDAAGMSALGLSALVAVISRGSDERAMVMAARDLLSHYPPPTFDGTPRRRSARELLEAMRAALPALERQAEAEERGSASSATPSPVASEVAEPEGSGDTDPWALPSQATSPTSK